MWMVSNTFILSLALLVIVCVVVGKFIFRKDTEAENRRRGAAKLANVLSRYGLKRIPDFLICYSVGDLSGMAKGILDWVKLFVEGGEEAVLKEFDEIFARVLDAKLLNAEARAYIQSRLNETKEAAGSTPASSPVSPTPTPVVTA